MTILTTPINFNNCKDIICLMVMMEMYFIITMLYMFIMLYYLLLPQLLTLLVIYIYILERIVRIFKVSFIISINLAINIKFFSLKYSKEKYQVLTN